MRLYTSYNAAATMPPSIAKIDEASKAAPAPDDLVVELIIGKSQFTFRLGIPR
jgi:hypothetical protein